MVTICVLEVPKDKLRYSADMLRYDCCYEATVQEDMVRISCIGFTLDRWKSFGVIPRKIAEYKVLERDAKEHYARAAGFTDGIRFAQNMLGGILAQP